MNRYLLEKDTELKSKSFNDASIENILFVYQKKDDEIENLIYKYHASKDGEFYLTDRELYLVNQETKYDYHILIKALLQMFIACSKEIKSSHLLDCCTEYIDKYFDNIKDINGGLPSYNLSVIIKWALKFFPRYREDISNLLYNKIINGDPTVIRYLSITNYLMRDKKLISIFSSNQYEDIYNKYLVDITDSQHIYLFLDIYEKYYEYILNNNKKIKKEFSKRYCDFVINNISLIENHVKQILLQRIRNIMDELKIYDDSQYSIIDDNLEAANRLILASLKQHTIKLPQKEVDSINTYIKKQNEIFSKMSNVEKIDKLMFEIYPISIEEVKKNIENRGVFSNFCEEQILDDEGKVINYKNLSETEMFSLKARQYISIIINLTFDLLIRPFFNNFSIDEDVKDYVNKMISNNKLISEKRVALISDYFLSLLNKDFKNSIYNIVEEFEESLRYYYKKMKMNIYKKNGKNDLIGLSTIFNDNPINSYRDKILETIDEDYYFTFKWFLVDNYGYSLRNKTAHRYNSENLYQNTYSIYIAIMILRLHWGFQN